MQGHKHVFSIHVNQKDVFLRAKFQIYTDLLIAPPPRCHLFVVGGLRTSMTWIAMLAGVFILLVGPPKSDRLKDRGQTK